MNFYYVKKRQIGKFLKSTSAQWHVRQKTHEIFHHCSETSPADDGVPTGHDRTLAQRRQ